MNGAFVLTGGAGFIGGCLLRKLNDEGIDDIIVVDNLDGVLKARNLEGKRFKRYIPKDAFLGTLAGRSPGRVSAVNHLGACSSTSATDSAYLARNNLEYSQTLAEWARDRGARFIYASSAATYGAGEQGYSDANGTTRRLQPLNLYGYYKQLIDLWMLDRGMDAEAAGIEFFNVFGPNEYHKGEMRSAVCRKFADVRDRGEIELFKSYRADYPDGEQKRDFIYVKDAVDVLLFFVEHPDKNGIFNPGTGIPRSWNDLAHAMASALRRKVDIRCIEMPESSRGGTSIAPGQISAN
jgi:ADP-L-glycero-D-manno-heptose 6-epimerase